MPRTKASGKEAPSNHFIFLTDLPLHGDVSQKPAIIVKMVQAGVIILTLEWIDESSCEMKLNTALNTEK